MFSPLPSSSRKWRMPASRPSGVPDFPASLRVGFFFTGPPGVAKTSRPPAPPPGKSGSKARFALGRRRRCQQPRQESSKSIISALTSLIVAVASGVRQDLRAAEKYFLQRIWQPAAGVSEGSSFTRMLLPCILVGALQFTSLDFAMMLFGMIATSSFPVHNVRRPPIGFDHLTLDGVVHNDPVARAIRALDIEHDAGEDIADQALQRQTDDDRQGTRGRERAFQGRSNTYAMIAKVAAR